MNAARVCIFGEVLFDHFPDGKRVLGGAPFNVAWHLQAFGAAPHFISRVGRDAEGETVRSAMQHWGMETQGLQTDLERPTGKVSVSFEQGEPYYDILQHCAYDAIAASEETAACKLLYHGSLALREGTSYEALQQLKATVPETIFVDVNLRAPWYQKQQLQALLRDAHWVKLNGDELAVLSPQQRAEDFLREYALQGLIVTQGSEGAKVFTAPGEQFQVRPEHTTEVVDTVGAGDAFAAVMILGLSKAWPLDITLQRAQWFASRVVGKRGATVNDPAFYQSFIHAWQLTTES